MTTSETIDVTILVQVSREDAFAAYTDPAMIQRWNFASADWHCPSAEVDLREGGRYSARMEAKDGSMGFDFAGTYEKVDPPAEIILRLDDGRQVRTVFQGEDNGTRLTTIFDPDNDVPLEMQRGGWQAILDNYAALLAQS